MKFLSWFFIIYFYKGFVLRPEKNWQVFENFSLKYRIPPVRWHQRNLINHSPNWVVTTVVNEKTKAFARMANGKIWTFAVPLCLRAVWAMIWKMSCAFNGLYYFLNYFRDDKSIEVIIQKELVRAWNFLQVQFRSRPRWIMTAAALQVHAQTRTVLNHE